MLRAFHIRLAPSKGAFAKRRCPDAGNGSHHLIKSHHMGDRQIQSRPGKARQVFHVGIAANKNTVSSIGPEGLFHGRSQPIPKFTARICVYNPLLNLL